MKKVYLIIMVNIISFFFNLFFFLRILSQIYSTTKTQEKEKRKEKEEEKLNKTNKKFLFFAYINTPFPRKIQNTRT